MNIYYMYKQTTNPLSVGYILSFSYFTFASFSSCETSFRTTFHNLFVNSGNYISKESFVKCVGERSCGGSNLQVTGCRSRVAACRSQVAGCRLQVAGCRSQVAGCRSWVAGRRLQVAG